MKNFPSVKMNDGIEVPVFGFGTFQIPADGSTDKALRETPGFCIYHIDTAAAYFNEHEAGRAILIEGFLVNEYS